MTPSARRTRFLLAVALSLLACRDREGGGPTPVPGATARPTSDETDRLTDEDGVCVATCARSAPLGCREAASCVRRCEELRAVPVCREKLRGVLRCFAMVPTSRWECGENGLPAVRDGECDVEQAEFAACLRAGG